MEMVQQRSKLFPAKQKINNSKRTKEKRILNQFCVSLNIRRHSRKQLEEIELFPVYMWHHRIWLAMCNGEKKGVDSMTLAFRLKCLHLLYQDQCTKRRARKKKNQQQHQPERNYTNIFRCFSFVFIFVRSIFTVRSNQL